MRWPARAAAGLAALALCGCGYSTGFDFDDPATTVGAAIFGNVSKERDLEVHLHGELTAALERMVRAPLVAPERADYLVEGSILSYERRRGIRDPNNVLLETGVRITVRARLVHRGPGLHPAPGQEPSSPALGALGSEHPAPEGAGPWPEGAPVEPQASEGTSAGRVLREVTRSSESGYRILEPQGEVLARERVLRNLADQVVLDLFATLAYEAGP